MISLLTIWRANGKWVPVNTRNAIGANIGYLDYVRCEWMFYHSSLADDVAALRAARPAQPPTNSDGGFARDKHSQRRNSVPEPDQN